MGFFDKIRGGRLFFGKKEPALLVELDFYGKRYVLEEFDLEFKQDVDDRNRPSSDVYGGIITFTMSDTPDDRINGWALHSYEKRSGRFRFLKNEKPIGESSPLIITFEDAYCVDYQKIMIPQGAGTLTTLVISSRILKIGNEEFANRWKD
ncbi:hypothetical protein FACS189437_07930 [Bacteroidia bacterium]|nr:hypothetical protein FACS189437_07930 [Bacteroidia bacterium]